MVSATDLMLTRLVRIYHAHVTIMSAGKRAAVLMYVLRVHIATGSQSAGVVATIAPVSYTHLTLPTICSV